MIEKKIAEKRAAGIPSDEKAITAALERAVKKALLFHKQMGHPIYIWENGQVVRQEAKDIKVDQEQL